jgi:membrane associated rhomboid family serine protease
MAESSVESLDTLLRQIEAAAPEPWYPKLHAETTGVPRDSLDMPLEKLRMAGLIRLTEWMEGRGQGYVLTPEGMHALKNERELTRLRDGKIRPRVVERPRREPRAGTLFDRGEDVRNVFFYPVNPVVTKILLFANILVFLVGYVLASQQKIDGFLAGPKNGAVPGPVWHILHLTGALTGQDIARGGLQWLRLVSSAFVHIGLLHLLMNCFALYVLGRDAESMFGHARFVLIYFLAIIGGGCGSLIEQPQGGAGASGAVCGLLGSIGVWFLLNRSHMPPEIASRGLRNVMINVVLVVGISLMPGVSKGGHLGGAIAGAATAVALHVFRYSPGMVRWLGLAALPLIPVASVGALMHVMNTNPRWALIRAAVQEEQAREEGRALIERYRNDALEADQKARDAYNSTYAILAVHPERRDRKEKQDAIETLTEARSGLTEAINRMSACPPARNATLEEARLGTVEYLQALAGLCDLSATYLREDRNLLNANLTALEEQMGKVKDLQKRWARYIQ